MAQITVGIPACKTDFLVQAISSVLTQTFTDFELLVADDSADGSVGDVVRRFQDPRIRLIEGARDGRLAACVRLWDNASCDLLKYVFDDDILYPTALAELSALLAKDPNYVFAFSRRAVIDDFGRVIRRPEAFVSDDWVWFGPTQIAEFLVRNVKNPAGDLSALLIRRSALADASCLTAFAGLPIRHQYGAAFLMNAAEKGPSVATAAELGAWRELAGGKKAPPPDHSRNLIEWEILVRGAVQRGLVTPQAALRGAPGLATLYHLNGQGFTEVHLLRRHLAELRELLGGDRRDVITPQFLEDLQVTDALIAMRTAQAASSDAAAPEPPQPARRVHGEVDSLTRRRARGWAWVPESPELAVRVEAVIGDRVVGQAIAREPRRDLGEWRTGTGNYGFELAFYEPLLTDEIPRFRVSVDGGEWLPCDLALPPLDEARMPVGDGARAVLAEHAKFTEPGPAFEVFDRDAAARRPANRTGADPLVVAFYLSQFHAIPENDAAWGEGFTEWRQLARATPRFPGHYQPRIPRDLGFYNLLDPDVMRRQCEMARAAGVGAFAFYYYWFNRKRVLEKPVETFLASDLDMPFLLIWANENWTRTWDGGAHDVILHQEYREEDEDALLADLARHMRDPRYVRLQGRPLFIIYNPDPIPNTVETLARWRRVWRDEHGLEPLIFMAQTFHREDPRTYGLDGALEFPPHKLANSTPRRDMLDAFDGDFAGQVIAYDDFVRTSLRELKAPFPLIKTALPGWDNEPRRPNRGLLLEESTPAKYQAWLQALVESAIERPIHGVPLVAVNAWNEWAEGAYLEPDVHYGSAYLNATGRAVARAVSQANTRAVVRRAKAAPQRDKFMVLGMPRTGSTLVKTTLGQHPNIRMHGELFHSVAAEREGSHAIETPDGVRFFDPEWQDPIEFLWENVWSAGDDGEVRAAGFKLFGEHVEGPGVGDLFARLKAELPGLKVISIWRDNLLDVLVSRRMAEATGEWVRLQGEARADWNGKLTVSVDDAESFFQRHAAMRGFLDAYVADMPAHHVSYTDLVSDYDGATRRMFDFLEVSPATVRAATVKQRTGDPSEVLENWDELEAYFRGTPFASYFSAGRVDPALASGVT